MSDPTPYFMFPGTARDALTFYADVFGCTVVDDLQRRPWGATDGQVIDRFGVRWLIGFEVEE